MLPSPAALTSALGLDVTRLEPTRPGDDDSLANGNWHLWTRDGEHHILRRAERGELLAGLHRDLRGLDLGPRPGFFETADLEAMGEFQDWDAGVAALRGQRVGLADRVDLAPELLDGYQRAAGEPLSELELAAIGPLQMVLRVLMVMAELWGGLRSGRFDEASIERQPEKFRS